MAHTCDRQFRMPLVKRKHSFSTDENILDNSALCTSYSNAKRLRLCSSRWQLNNSVHDRVFKFRRKTSLLSSEAFSFGFSEEKRLALGCERFTTEFPSLEMLFGESMKNSQTHSPIGKLNLQKLPSSIPSSTPFCKEAPGEQSVEIAIERQIYKRLLNEASNRSLPQARLPTKELTIVIDDDATESNSLSELNKCSLSPIRTITGETQIQSTSKTPLSRNIIHAQAVSAPVVATQSDAVDRQAQSWLQACERTPFLSTEWLNNLTVKYRDRAEHRARERELVESKLRYFEKQREMSHRLRMESLEQRLSCLLLTPPVLSDPYLVPQPIPFELPYKPTIRSAVPSLPVLTEAQWAEVEAVLRSGSPGDVLVENFRLSVTRKELLTLTASNWLSDMVINFYMQLLYHRSQSQQGQTKLKALPRVAVLTTFFYPKLTSSVGGGYSGVRRWSRQLKLLDQDLVFIPIHDRGMHWCLSCIDFRSKTITYYDSMGSRNDKCLQSLRNYLEEECRDKKGHPLPDADSWKMVNTEDSVPQQMNGSDCGVFMCTYAEFLSRNADFNFTQSDMPGIRKRMIYEILHQELLSTGFAVEKFN